MLTLDAHVLQEALHDESADQVAVNFFGDGTANNGMFLTASCLLDTCEHIYAFSWLAMYDVFIAICVYLAPLSWL